MAKKTNLKTGDTLINNYLHAIKKKFVMVLILFKGRKYEEK